MSQLYLTDRCAVQHATRNTQAYGGKKTYAAAHLTSEPCRLIRKTQRGLNALTGEWQVTDTFTMLFQHGRDVVEGDQITNIVLADGTTLSENYEVDGGALPRRGKLHRHLSVAMKKVS